MTKARRAPLFAFALSIVALFALSGCGPKYPKCDKDSHCEEKGEVCVEGMCQQCRDESNCASGQMCNNGRCEAKPECSSNGDCEGNKICRSGKCQIECNGDGDCGAGLKCSNNRCVDQLACNATSDCEAGMACVNGRCQAMTAKSSKAMCDWPTVQFDFNRANLSTRVKNGLEQIAECIRGAGGTVIIEGHADERGTEEYNLALGDRRARAVTEYLRRLGVDSGKLDIISKGETDPVDNGHDEAAWAKNRRVEFIAR